MSDSLEDLPGLNILSTLLFETPDSPFMEKFLLTNKYKGYCAGYGFEQNTPLTYFTVGLKGVAAGQETNVSEEILKLIEKVVEKGFDKSTVHSVLHQVELNAKMSNGFFGLKLLQSNIGSFVNQIDQGIH